MEKEELKKAIYQLIEQSAGKKKYKQADVIKHFRQQGIPDAETKAAIRELIDSGELIYTYFGGSYIELGEKRKGA
ncbi:hypothetical protein V4D30_08570 [Thermodesulfovibrio sp. 3907-1M]|uniref:Sulfite reductase n=1 Tax=Thermodesulfovibrio autotrophicus TaxID=3118333 RepID=A0AAU8GYN2_9BACT